MDYTGERSSSGLVQWQVLEFVWYLVDEGLDDKDAFFFCGVINLKSKKNSFNTLKLKRALLRKDNFVRNFFLGDNIACDAATHVVCLPINY